MKRIILGLGIALMLALIAVAGATAWLLYSNGGARWLLGQAQERIPGELRVATLDGSLARGLQMEGLYFANPAMQVEIASLRVTLRTGHLPLTLRIRDLQADGVRYRMLQDDRTVEPAEPVGSLALPLTVEVDRFVVGRFVVESASGEQVFTGGLEARFTAFERLRIEHARLESDLGTLDFSGRVGLAPPWRLRLAVVGDLRPVLAEGEPPARLRFESDVEGPLDDYRFTATGALAGGPLGDEHRFEFESSGSTERLQFGALSIDGPTVRLDSRGLLDWTAQILELEALQFAVPGTGLEANADLAVDLTAGRVAGEVAWRGFDWPLRDTAPRVSSRAGRATIGGSPDDWSISGRADLVAEGLPPAELQFSATGDRHGLRAEIAEGAALGGTFGGELSWSWEGAQPLTATLRFEALETSPLAPDWPGRLDGALTLAGQLEPLALDIDVARVQGELRRTPVSGEGRIRYDGRRLSFDGFAVEAGGSRVTLAGDAATPDGLEFDLEVSNPGVLLPGVAGRASGRGVISLAGPTPRISVDLDGADLAWGDYRIDRFELHNAPVTGAAPRSRLVLSGEGLAWNGQAVDTVELAMTWSALGQDIELRLAQDVYGVTASAAGQLENPDAPLADWRWAGELTQLALSDDSGAPLQLTAPATIAVSIADARVDDVCLESTAPAKLCVDIAWTASEGLGGVLSLDHFPLDLAARRLDAGIQASQVISGTFEFAAPPEQGFSGTAELGLSPGTLRYIDDPDVALETAAGRIEFSMADGRLSAGRFVLPMPGQGAIEMDFDVERLGAGVDSPVSGRLHAELADLDVLTLLIPAVDRMAGRLEATFDLTGTVGRPGLNGHVALTDGALTNLASGFQLSDLQLSGAVDSDRQTRLNGRFRAVEGVGELAAVLDLRSLYDPRVILEIGGENLALFDTASLKITATPDMQLDWRGGAVEIGGTLAIPRGLVAPKVIPMKSAGESEDAEIVAGALPEQQSRQPSAPLEIQGSLDVILGQDVTVKLPVAEAKISGTTRFTWSGEPVPVGDGGFNLRGKILAFGQLLEITEGGVSFPGSRADNPHLNIQAEREIYGNSEIRRAGVLVAGTLRRPVIEPYTEPMTNRERARTLLVTGSDFNMERGVGTVDVGTYIAPRIFVSYGVGVFDQENVFSVRYDLGRGWGVKATSGEKQTGVDVSYTVER